MGKRHLIILVIAGHVAVLSAAAIVGGCAREKFKKDVGGKLPYGELRPRESRPEPLLEPEGLVEERDLLVAREPETIAVVSEQPLKKTRPGKEIRKPVIKDVRAKESARSLPAGVRRHVVAQGDNLWKISRLYGVTIEELMGANDIKRDVVLQIGQVLIIPSSGIAHLEAKEEAYAEEVPSVAEGEGLRKHVVKKGESLWQIARMYGVSVKDIGKANDIEDTSRIRIGQELIIPDRGGRTPENPVEE